MATLTCRNNIYNDTYSKMIKVILIIKGGKSMVRQIIKIDEELCVGCGLCVNACHEGAIGLIDGKARLLRDDYCDGLGNCLPVCPTGAISFELREAMSFDKEEVKKKIEENKKKENAQESTGEYGKTKPARSMLRQWPVQLQLVAPNASFFNNADLLIAADCTAFSYGDFHSFMKDKVTLIGCPKLDDIDYSEKLTQILKNNTIQSVTIIRMEVPCCGGIVNAVKTALINYGELIPWRIVTISCDGIVISDTK